MIRRFISNLPFYRFRTNWHSFPGLNLLLCWIGRHDYEFFRLSDRGAGELQCFYCLRKKNSSTSTDLEPNKLQAICMEARRIIESEWKPGEWPPDRQTAMFLMQLTMRVGRLDKPDWKPPGVNEPELVDWNDIPTGGYVPPHSHLMMLLGVYGWEQTDAGWEKNGKIISKEQILAVDPDNIRKDALQTYLEIADLTCDLCGGHINGCDHSGEGFQ